MDYFRENDEALICNVLFLTIKFFYLNNRFCRVIIKIFQHTVSHAFP